MVKRSSRNVYTENTQVIRTITPRQLQYCITLANLDMKFTRWTTVSEAHKRYLYEYLVNDKKYDFSFQAVSEFYDAIRSLNLKAPHLVALKHAPVVIEHYAQGYHLLREIKTGYTYTWPYLQDAEFNRRAIVAKLFRTYDMATRKAIVATWHAAKLYDDCRTMTQRLNDMSVVDEIPF